MNKIYCHDDDPGSNVHGCCDDFAFTVTLENTILSIITLTIVLILTIAAFSRECVGGPITCVKPESYFVTLVRVDRNGRDWVYYWVITVHSAGGLIGVSNGDLG